MPTRTPVTRTSHWVLTAVGVAAVIGLAACPWAVPYVIGIAASAGILAAGVRGFAREQRARREQATNTPGGQR